jgi:NitT/TauT family transport system substrate-binding protein
MNLSRILAVVALSATSAAFSSAEAQTKVAIGYPTASDFLPAYVAADNGCFARYKIEPVMTRIPVISNIVPALVSNSLQIGASTPPILVQAIDSGLDIVAISGSSLMTKGSEVLSLVTRADQPIKSAVDLKGKKIGVPGLNSVAHVVFRKWLKNAGVEQDVTYIETTFPQMNDLLKSKTLDGVLAVEPIRSGIVNSGTGVRAPEEYFTAVKENMLLTMWIASGKWAKENPEIVKNFRTCIGEGIAFIKSNPEETKAIEKKYVGFNSPVYPEMRNSLSPDEFAFHIDLAKEFKLIRRDIDPSKLVLQ